jgi:hypothetical protein
VVPNTHPALGNPTVREPPSKSGSFMKMGGGSLRFSNPVLVGYWVLTRLSTPVIKPAVNNNLPANYWIFDNRIMT